MLEEDNREHEPVMTDSSAASPHGDASEDTTMGNAARDKREHEPVMTNSSAASPHGDASEDTTMGNTARDKIDDQQWYSGEIEMDNHQGYVYV